MYMLLVVLPIICLWVCFWVLPAMLWYCGRRAELQRRVALTAPSRAERALAEERAAELLRALLEESEYQQLLQCGYVDVPSPGHAGRLYRIPRNPGRVRVFEGGRALLDLCIGPTTPLPAYDVVALHKLMIEGSEDTYLASANVIPFALPPAFLPL